MGTKLMPDLDQGNLADIALRFAQGAGHLADTNGFLADWTPRAYNGLMRALPEEMSERERERAANALARQVKRTQADLAKAISAMNSLASIAGAVVENAHKATRDRRQVRSGA